MSDPAFSAYDYIDWYNQLAMRFGGLYRLRNFARAPRPVRFYQPGGSASDVG